MMKEIKYETYSSCIWEYLKQFHSMKHILTFYSMNQWNQIYLSSAWDTRDVARSTAWWELLPDQYGIAPCHKISEKHKPSPL